MIKPTVGRVVWYDDGSGVLPQPQAAIVAFVHSDRMVNLAVVGQNGDMSPRTSVTLRQPEDERPTGSFCEWMPYQQGQAAKSEALEQKLAEKV